MEALVAEMQVLNAIQSPNNDHWEKCLRFLKDYLDGKFKIGGD